MLYAIRVYPRVYGGTPVMTALPEADQGLSPRVRGNREVPPQKRLLCGSIPACAGEPDRDNSLSRLDGVYPRVCGGPLADPSGCVTRRGLSPRVRGNPMVAGPLAGWIRSIPACAGEPRGKTMRRYQITVYPRVCGGTFRARLNPSDWSRSIPACAGEPDRCCRNGICQVYPRVCGGTYRTLFLDKEDEVYPRVCGGTPHFCAIMVQKWGLSPRVRGNLAYGSIGLRLHGSIPACAGEPSRMRAAGRCVWVYPRVCGGTS